MLNLLQVNVLYIDLVAVIPYCCMFTGPQEVTIIVKAMDEGTPPLSSEVSVKLIILSADHYSDSLRNFPSIFVIPDYAKPGKGF